MCRLSPRLSAYLMSQRRQKPSSGGRQLVVAGLQHWTGWCKDLCSALMAVRCAVGRKARATQGVAVRLSVIMARIDESVVRTVRTVMKLVVATAAGAANLTVRPTSARAKTCRAEYLLRSECGPRLRQRRRQQLLLHRQPRCDGVPPWRMRRLLEAALVDAGSRQKCYRRVRRYRGSLTLG